MWTKDLEQLYSRAVERHAPWDVNLKCPSFIAGRKGAWHVVFRYVRVPGAFEKRKDARRAMRALKASVRVLEV